MSYSRAGTMVAAVFAALWIPTVAAAQEPPYSNPDPPEVEGNDLAGGFAAPEAQAADASAGLPVTGSDVAGLVVVGGGLAGVGVAALAASRRRSSARV